nr:hypothetical protein [Tanacetum cinerariifolium]
MENMTEESAGKLLSNTVRKSAPFCQGITTLSSSNIFKRSCMTCAGNGVPSPKASSPEPHMKRMFQEKQKASYEKVAKQKTKVYARNGGLKLYSCLKKEKMETIIEDKSKKMEEKNKKVVDSNKPKCPAYSFLIFSEKSGNEEKCRLCGLEIEGLT